MNIDVVVPASGASLTVVAGAAAVPVYSDAGLTTTVTQPYALPSSGTVTLYVRGTESWMAMVTAGSGAVIARAGGRAGGTVPLVIVCDKDGNDLKPGAEADLTSTYARLSPNWLEDLSLTIYGHSWTVSPGKYSSPGAEWMNRVADRLRLNVSRRGVSGASMVDVASDCIGAAWRGALTLGAGDNFTGNLRTWGHPTPGIVMLQSIINDAQGANYADAMYQSGFTESLRAILAFLTAGSRVAPTVGAGATVSGFTGTLLGDQRLPSGNMIRSAVGGDYVEWPGVAIPAGSTTAHVLTLVRQGSDFTGFDVKVDGATVVSGWSPTAKFLAFNGYGYGMAAVPIPVTAGTRTIRVTAAGTATFLSDLLVPTATPPLVIVCKEAITNVGYPTYHGFVDTVAAEFAARNVKVLNLGATGWNAATMCGPDAVHLTALGHAFVADLVEATIRSYVTTYQAGVTHSLTALH